MLGIGGGDSRVPTIHRSIIPAPIAGRRGRILGLVVVFGILCFGLVPAVSVAGLSPVDTGSDYELTAGAAEADEDIPDADVNGTREVANASVVNESAGEQRVQNDTVADTGSVDIEGSEHDTEAGVDDLEESADNAGNTSAEAADATGSTETDSGRYVQRTFVVVTNETTVTTAPVGNLVGTSGIDNGDHTLLTVGTINVYADLGVLTAAVRAGAPTGNVDSEADEYNEPAPTAEGETDGSSDLDGSSNGSNESVVEPAFSKVSDVAEGIGAGLRGLPWPLGLGGLVGVGAFVLPYGRVSAAYRLFGVREAVGSSAVELLSEWLGRLLPVVGLAGYQRYADDDPLEHPRRAALYDAIRDEPGIYLSALADATDLPLGTVRYHLKILTFEGLVNRTDANGRRRYAPIGVEPDVIETLLEKSAARAVLEALAERETATVGELATLVDRAPSTVTHHTTRLAEMGLVEREPDGRTTYNRLTDEGCVAMRHARSQAATEATGGEPVPTLGGTMD